MNRMKLVLILILLIAIILAALYQYRQQQREARIRTGTLEVTTADISPKTSGYIKNLRVKEGDAIHQGDVVAILDRKDLEAALLRDKAAYAQAKTNLLKLENGSRSEEIRAAAANTAAAQSAYDKAQRDYSRSQALVTYGAIAASAYDDAVTARKSAEAQLNAASEQELLLQNGPRYEEVQSAQEEVTRQQAVIDMSQEAVQDLTVYCPLDGFILTKNFEPGEYVNAGSPIATVADMSDCWVKVYVSSSELGTLAVGQKATVRIDALPSQAFTGHIKEISDKAEYTPRQSITKNERANLVFYVKVAIDNRDGIMKPGMPADVIFHE